VPGNVGKRHHFYRECEEITQQERSQHRKPGTFRAFLGNGILWYVAFMLAVGAMIGVLQLVLPVVVAGVLSVVIFGYTVYRGGLGLVVAIGGSLFFAFAVTMIAFVVLEPALGDGASIIALAVGLLTLWWISKAGKRSSEENSDAVVDDR
jgi:predicted membrane protein